MSSPYAASFSSEGEETGESGQKIKVGVALGRAGTGNPKIALHRLCVLVVWPAQREYTPGHILPVEREIGAAFLSAK